MVRRNRLLIPLFVSALLFKLFYAPLSGMHDMAVFVEWGKEVNRLGLANAYIGIYFPIQYQIFQSNIIISEVLNVSPYTVIKYTNLLFDLGIFVVLINLLKMYGKDVISAFVYWSHPWFLSMFALGYVDFQFTFFVVLSVLLFDKADTFFKVIVSGIPLGIAFLMKPQAALLILAGFFYIILKIIMKKKWRTVGILVPSVVLFFSYSMYFYFSGKSLFYLGESYLEIKKWMPCLTANMLNIWYPIAYLLQKPGQYIYEIKDDLLIWGVISSAKVGLTLFVSMLVIYTFLLVFKFNGPNKFKNSLILLFGFTTLIFPMVMTGVHENHLFLGTVFFVPLIQHMNKSVFYYGCHLLLLTMFLNLIGHYGLGDNISAGIFGYFVNFMRNVREIRLILSLASIIAFVVLVFVLFEYVLDSAVKDDAHGIHTDPSLQQ